MFDAMMFMNCFPMHFLTISRAVRNFWFWFGLQPQLWHILSAPGSFRGGLQNRLWLSIQWSFWHSFEQYLMILHTWHFWNFCCCSFSSTPHWQHFPSWLSLQLSRCMSSADLSIGQWWMTDFGFVSENFADLLTTPHMKQQLLIVIECK